MISRITLIHNKLEPTQKVNFLSLQLMILCVNKFGLES